MESALLQALANERRRVLSDWRTVILLQRAWPMLAIGEKVSSGMLPQTPEEARQIIKSLLRRNAIEPIPGISRVYLVTNPYASTIPVSELEVIGEVNPYSSMSHFSALEFHGLTLQFPTTLYATFPKPLLNGEIPIGTQPEDWERVEFSPRSGRSAAILGKPIKWRSQHPNAFFGHTMLSPHGYPVRVTDIERTLLDAIDSPHWCGGIFNVLEAWKAAREQVRIDRIVSYVDRLNRPLLRQRVGYLLETLGFKHESIEEWKSLAIRGGSMKLDGSSQFASRFSPAWNLSLNAPVEILEDDYL